MENASKALIIAGAILLAILIIGLGMFIYNQAANTLNSANLNSEEARQYNTQFLNYEGTAQGSEVKTLINNVKAHNRQSGGDPSKMIGIAETVYKDGEVIPAYTDAPEVANIKVLSGKTYTVTFAYDADTGFITSVGIKLKENSAT